jgi:hypothetical protein
MDNFNKTTHGEELPQDLQEAIHKLAQAGASHQEICSALGLRLEQVQRVLTKDRSQDAMLTESIKEKTKKYKPVMSNRLMTSPVIAPDDYIEQHHLEAHPSSEHVMLSQKKKAKISEVCLENSYGSTQYFQAQLYEDALPTFIYSYKYDTHKLYWTSLVTGVQSKHRVPSYTFEFGCCWTEVPGRSLLITGGGYLAAVREVVRIDTRREFAVTQHAPMLTPRREHAAVYHTQHLYVLGGVNDDILGECERYACEQNLWEALPPLPSACCEVSVVVVENDLYALGGWSNTGSLDLVQRLSLECFTWELLQMRLLYAGSDFPCFKVRDTEVYLVANNILCSFNALGVYPLKTLTEDIFSTGGASYYNSGTLYCSSLDGAAESHEIGSLSNS